MNALLALVATGLLILIYYAVKLILHVASFAHWQFPSIKGRIKTLFISLLFVAQRSSAAAYLIFPEQKV